MEKILVVQTAFPGDAILTLPMIQKLSQVYEKTEIDVIAIPSTQEIFRYSPYVNEVIVFDKKGEHHSLFSLFSLAAKLKKQKYSRIFSPHRSARSSILVYLTGVKKTYGFDIASLSWLYKYRIKYNSQIHEVQRNLSLIGFDVREEWKIQPEIKRVSLVEELLPEKSGGKTIAIAPGSVWETKKYPVNSFKSIVESLLNLDYRIILIGGKEDRLLCEELNIALDGRTRNFAGHLSIVESVELLRHCSLLVSNDSAPTHMAMSAGIPAVTIYCSTVPEFGFYPYNINSKSVSLSNLSCKPCGIHGHKSCPIKTFECGLLLNPNDIINEIKSAIK